MSHDGKALTPETCAALIRASRRIVVLTGAGISTSAGIPDFRGPNGLYVTRTHDPDKVFCITAFDRDPEPFYAFSRDFLGVCRHIRPSLTHCFLAALERDGRLDTVITQNIDPLHAVAGSRNVVYLHGSYRTGHCRACGAAFGFDDLLEDLEGGRVPHCPCGGVIKPDIVFFGEPVNAMPVAERAVRACDLLLVLGSSLAVYPAALLPQVAPGPVAVVNRGGVGLPPGGNFFVADALLDDFFRSVAEILPA